MKIFLFICLAVGWASTEKLDRSYLPPPGSKFSGGSPGDIQVPLEFPKLNYSTGRPQVKDGIPDVELGINQRPLPSGTVQGSTQRPDGSTYFQNSYAGPKTTTSYAITQTTTFGPDDYQGLDQSSGFVNASINAQQSGLPQYPQSSGQNYQQRQPIRGQLPNQGQNYSQYQQGLNYQTTSTPYGTTQRPFVNIQNSRAYLPPAPSSVNKGQTPTGQLFDNQDGFGYPSGQPEGPKYQDGPFRPTTGPDFIEGTNQQNVFIGKPSTSAPQYQDERYSTTTRPINNQQRFGSRVPTQQNQQRFQGTPNFPSSTASPGQFTTSNGQNIYANQEVPSSTFLPQYQYGQRLATPGSNQQDLGSRLPQQNQNRYPGNLNVPSTTASPQYQDGQKFVTPGLVQQNQFTGNQLVPSTAAPQFQGNQRYTPGAVQEGFAPNQQGFGPQIYNQQNQNKYGDQNLPSSTAIPQLQNGQTFTSPGAVQQQQQNQYSGKQIFPSSTPAPQYQNEQRYTTPGAVQKGFPPNQQRFGPQISNQQTENKYSDRNFPSSTGVPQLQNGQIFTTPGALQQQPQNQYPGTQNFPSSTSAPQYQNGQRYTTPGTVEQIVSLAPGQQNQNLYPGNQFFPSTTTPQNTNLRPQQQVGSPAYTQQNQAQYQGNQNIPSSSARPQLQNGPFVTPGLVQQNQYPSGQNVPSTAFPQIQSGQRFTPGPQQGSNQLNYPESQTVFENGDQQYPSTGTPQYQSTLSPTSGSNLGLIPNEQNSQYPSRPGYNQQFPSTTAPQGFPQQQYGDNRVQTLPGAGVSYPAKQGTASTSPNYGNEPSSPTGSQVYGTTPSAPGYYNQPSPNVIIGSVDSIGALVQNRPDRPNAESDRTATILSYENVLTPEGYMYSYDTSNAIHVDETGVVDDGTKAQGSFSYIGDDGKTYSVIYSADENGFQPKGDHLPTPPPIPEAIQRVIEQANKDKESGIEDDGLYDEEKYGHMKYDGSLSTFRPRNKTVSLVNGADIPNSYESRIGGKNRNQLKNKGGNKSNSDEKSMTEYEYEEPTDENTFDDINGNDNNEGISNKYPTADKDTINRPNYDKIQKGKINSNANVGSMKSRKPVAGKDTSRRPVSSNIKQDGAFDDVTVTDISEGNDDVEGSQDYDESDLVNYKDDPNSRTDFHGINRYLPNPKGSSRFNQTDSKRVLLRPDGTKQKVKGINESEQTENRKNQFSQDTDHNPESEIEEETINDDRNRNTLKNKIAQNKIESSKTYKKKPTNKNDESEINVEDREKENEKYASYDELITGDGDISTQPGVYQFDKKIVGKPKRPNVNQRTGVSKINNIKTISDEETGYEYNPPQRKFDSEGATRLPSRTSATRKPQFPLQGGQTTVRPFITPNVYNKDKTQENYDDQFYSEGKPFRPVRPITSQIQKNNEGLLENDKYSNNAYPQVNENERFDATRRPTGSYATTPPRRPFGRPQTTPGPSNKNQDTIIQDKYDEPNYQGPRRPGNKVIYGGNSPIKGISKTENNAFVSTTPLPNMGYQSLNGNQRPDQYQETNISNDPSYFDGTSPNKDLQMNTSYRPGSTNFGGKVPSTTFRPSYTFEDKTLAPSGPITVDGFGRPISSTNPLTYGTTSKPVTQDSRIPIENQPEKVGGFRPNEGRFGVTSAPTKGTTGYQGSTPGPSEDFSGPKQPQRFDPDTGYHY